MEWKSLCVVALIASVASLAISYYSLMESRRGMTILRGLLTAASIRDRIARALAKAGRRPRRRYIVFEIITSTTLSREDVEKAINDTFRKLYGTVGASMTMLRLVDYDEVSRRGILRVRGEYKYWVLTTLALIREIAGVRVLVLPLAVHGTVRRARKRLHRY